MGDENTTQAVKKNRSWLPERGAPHRKLMKNRPKQVKGLGANTLQVVETNHSCLPGGKKRRTGRNAVDSRGGPGGKKKK